ncbi:DUF2637 domain-containing protein [Streptomyces sp. NBC_01497]|uniref:DUF2637 domain-containing protein n=1 Tax=Streptomyces sp. NBC_01497 TaxID=2903885 RepID=UPI002E370BE8|nr:DUF2637 domain-containing protein [Streptomyces sp. NBC_01497]
MAAMQLSRTHRILVAVVITGAVIIAGIGFSGSYAAVRSLAESKGFGEFSLVFPIGIDAGICVLLALDLLLTWIRIPFPLLRQAAWVLTAATIAFNGAAAWPDPLGVGMHAVIPLLFIVTVEAARHAVGRIADITADKHMEGVRLTRWLLSPVPTFLLWRRMKLWELRSYEQVIKLEQDRLIYQSRLQARFGRSWRRKAPVESLMPLRLAKYGVPLADTASAGLAAAGIDPVPAIGMAVGGAAARELTAPRPVAGDVDLTKEAPGFPQGSELPQQGAPMTQRQAQPHDRPSQGQGQGPGPYGGQIPQQHPQQGDLTEQQLQQQQEWAEQQGQPEPDVSPWFAAPNIPEGAYEGAYNPTYVEGLEPTPVLQPTGPGRVRPQGGPGIPAQRQQRPEYAQRLDHEQPQGPDQGQAYEQGLAQDQAYAQGQAYEQGPEYEQGGPEYEQGQAYEQGPEYEQPQDHEQRAGQRSGRQPAREAEAAPQPGAQSGPAPLDERAGGDELPREEAYYNALRKYISEYQDMPNERQFGRYLQEMYNFRGRSGGPLSESTLRAPLREAQRRFQEDLDSEHIA